MRPILFNDVPAPVPIITTQDSPSLTATGAAGLRMR